jgi:oligoribonuclease
MDLEMTGLNPETDVIVEIATLVTDDELNIIAEGPNLVIFQPEEALASMGDFVTQMHTTSGLLELIKTSTISHDEAMQQTLDFIKEHSPESGKIPLCGNSIRTDRSFLEKYMPEIEHWLHYRCVDVSTVKELVKRWYPNIAYGREINAGQNHRAMDDIRDSVEEMRYYRNLIFRDPAEVKKPAKRAQTLLAP